MESLITPTLQAALEAQAIREGLLSRDDYAYGELHDFSKVYSTIGSPHVLAYLCLFPNLQGTQSEFNLGGLADRMGFKFAAISPRDIRAHMIGKELGIPDAKLKTFMEECHDRAYQSFVEQRQIILSVLHASLVGEWDNGSARMRRSGEFYINSPTIKNASLTAIDLMSSWYADDFASPPWGYGVGAEEILSKEAGVPQSLFSDPNFELWLDKLDDFYVRHFATIFWSGLNDKALAAGVPGRRRPSISSENRETAARIATLVSVNFRDELRMVPDPRGIEEAIEMSNTKEMNRLREKILEWMAAAGAGEASLESRIRNDIAKASREIRFLRRYKELSESPWVFTAKFAVGFVPVVSNVVSVIDYGISWYDNFTTQKNIWVSVNEKSTK
jgi:hypothetical protein